MASLRGMSANEISMDEWQRARNAGTPADPATHGNGRYGAPANPEVPTTGVRAASMPTEPPSRLARMAGSATSGLRGFVSTPSPGMAAAGALQGAANGYSTPTSDYYRRLGMDPAKEEGTNGFKDLAVRGVGVASDVGAALLDAPMAAVNGVRQRFGAQPLETFGEILRKNDKAPGATDLPAISVRAGQPAVAAPAAAQGDVPAGWSSQDLAGADGVRRMTTPDSRTLFTNVTGPDNAKLMSSKPGLSVVPGMARSEIDAALARRDADQAAAAAAVQTQPLTVGARGARMEDDLRAKNEADSGPDVYDRLASMRGGRRSSERIAAANMRNQAAMQQRALASSDANAERAAQISLRGQDLSAETARAGQQLTAASARANARMDQLNKDRQYQLDVAKVGQDQAKTMFDQREKAQKGFDDWAGSIFTTKDDKGNAVPDGAKKAEFVRTASVALGNMISSLQQKGDADSLKKAAQLSQQGFGALDNEDKAMLKVLFDRRERHAAARGIGPFSAGGPVSDNLLDFAITGDASGDWQKRVKLAGGQTIGDNDLRYTEPANAVLPDLLKTPTTNLGPTAREREYLKGVR